LGNWSRPDKLSPIQKLQTGNSDLITFHHYGKAREFARRVGWLKQFDRPIMCTEYMARSVGSTFKSILPHAKQHGVGTFCWGLVAGRTQTHYHWNTSENPHIVAGSRPWFHDVLHQDGRPHRPHEVYFLRKITGRAHVI
jgi:hypothetical protein